LNVHSFNCR